MKINPLAMSQVPITDILLINILCMGIWRTKFARESLALSREEDLDDVHARRDVFALLIVAILLLKMDAFCEDIFLCYSLCYLDVKLIKSNLGASAFGVEHSRGLPATFALPLVPHRARADAPPHA